LPSDTNLQEDIDFGLPPGQTSLPEGVDDMEEGLSEREDLNFDEEEDMEDDVSENESDEESEMVVLDPDHPLMTRFQNAYKTHLLKQTEKVMLELRELNEDMSKRKHERENLGVELYGVQQELARQQMLLEKNHDSFNVLTQARSQCEEKLSDVRDMHKDSVDKVGYERKTVKDLQTEVENLAARLKYMDDAKEDVRSDIAVMKRAAEKADLEVSKAEGDKKRQDLLVDRLTQTVDTLREEIAMYESQFQAQHEESKAAQQALTEAVTEIEAIDLEKKQLYQQWQSSLIGMRRRDEAYAAMNEALSLQRQRIQAIETETEGYKRSISKAQEQNEQLTMMDNKIQSDIASSKKNIAISLQKQETLKSEYSTYTRTLHQTEKELNKANIDVTLKENELVALRKQTEREFLEKVRLETAIMEKIQEEMTMDKASKYTRKLIEKLRRRTTELENALAEVENEISRDVLDISNTTTRVRQLQQVLDSINDEIQQKNGVISRIDSDIIKKNAVIERKQGTIDQFNKRVDQLRNKDGGEELGPLELQVSTLQKQIESRQNEISDLQQFWLRVQSELVKTMKDVDKQSKDIDVLKKQHTILQQKKIRTEGEIESHKNEMRDSERNIRNMQNDMTKLNLLINKESGMKEFLQQNNILMENDFIQTLKEAELESINMQSRIEALKEEKEMLLNSLVEAERQIMLWEKKTQLAREAKQSVDAEYGQGDIKAMKAEIHRMEVRYAQLMKQQEKMIQDMEKAVTRRDVIITRGDAQVKSGKAKDTKGVFQKKLMEMKKKIKQVNQDANGCDNEIQSLREQQGLVSHHLEEKQSTCHEMQSGIDELESQIDTLSETRQRNLAEILALQQKFKYYQALKEGRYTPLCKTAESLQAETQKQRDRLQSLMTIVDRLNQEYPHAQPALRKITLSLSYKAMADE